MGLAYKNRLMGEGNPVWRGGRARYKGKGWKEISVSVIARDGKCADCGSATDLDVHHIIPQRFWLDRDEANKSDNLVTLCSRCHPRRPEHYWTTLPDDLYIEGLHSKTPVHRSSSRLRPKPLCEVCGKPLKSYSRRYCSHSCANKARWQNGMYGPELANNFKGRSVV